MKETLSPEVEEAFVQVNVLHADLENSWRELNPSTVSGGILLQVEELVEATSGIELYEVLESVAGIVDSTFDGLIVSGLRSIEYFSATYVSQGDIDQTRRRLKKSFHEQGFVAGRTILSTQDFQNRFEQITEAAQQEQDKYLADHMLSILTAAATALQQALDQIRH